MTTTTANKKGSRVRVGVRVRPLTSKEINQGGNSSLNIDSPTIRMGRRGFTYDAVFDSNYGQTELYESISTPLLSSFADGYNATIMAYGQTGSGKTFTMGSEAHVEPEESSQAGLIPRFITDFFLEMQQKKTASDKGIEGSQVLLDYHLKASFLEVYGEDVYDLLDANRSSLPLREDSKGGIVVVGLKNRSISNTAEALQVLHEGTMNRTTAATLMNHTSSRSHAVFTIHLSQVTRRSAGDSTDVSVTSQFTFVDLAGSERMKKTGAEGERAREGIKINEGLLALGNVINALADEDKVKKDKKVHVPYRQSKLTRLLQDALGGNSQTFFLACVSPSDTNASETISTLNYANRARNIHNAPTKNIDATSAEVERLKSINRVLQFELVKSRFQIGRQAGDQNGIGEIDESLLKRNDVEAYIQQVYKVAGATMSPSKMSPSTSPLSFDISSKPHIKSENRVVSRPRDPTNRNPTSDKFDHSILEDINPDEEMAILDHLLELQQHDHEYEKGRQQGDIQLKEMDGELEKQETMLLHLRDSLKVYHGLKGKYEELMEEVRQLENEKSSLAKQLDRAKTDPTNGSSAAIKRKLEKVEKNLSRARQETLNHRQKQRHGEAQTRKCKVLERKVNELKHSKLSLLKKQKEDAARYKKTTEAKTKELLALKRTAKTTDKRMSKLENELNIQKKNYNRRTQYCTKLSEKLKSTEEHLVKVLAMRQTNLSEHKVSSMQRLLHKGRRYLTKSEKNVKDLSEEEIKATKYIFDRMVVDKVKQTRLKKKYGDLVTTYSETMRKVVSEVKALKQARGRLNDDPNESVKELNLIKDLEENIVDLEFKLELLDSELQEISAQMPDHTSSSEEDIEDAVGKLMKTMSSSALRSVLLETFSKFVEAETERQTITELLDRKDAALLGVESEVDSLNFKLKLLSKDLAHRKAIDEAGNDHFLTIKKLTDERNIYKDDLLDAQSKLEDSNKKMHRLENSLSSVQVEMLVSKEKLAAANASLKREGGNEKANKTISQLQQTWEELGADGLLRENAQKRIEFCLEDTCANLLDNATVMKCSTEKEISALSSRLHMTKAALGVSTEDSHGSPNKGNLILTLTDIKDQLRTLEVPYRFAAARRGKIVEGARDLSNVLGLSFSKLHDDLQVLLQRDNNEANITHNEFGNPNTTAGGKNILVDVLPARCLETDFLTRCEGHVSELRVAKSEMLLKTRELQQKIAVLIGEMHLNESQSLALIEEWIKQNESTYPKRWDSKLAEDILRDLVQTKFLSSSSVNLSQHLELMSKALSSSADSRRSISETLKAVIEHAQKTLLDIVGRELDASEAYAGFHDALFRMPPLSKDLILSCISELEALIDGTEAMAQTEIEALTVVWEALKVSQKERRNFWGMLEKSKSNLGLENENPFSEKTIGVVSSHERWMVDAVKSATDSYRILKTRLRKLQGINTQVERLRSKQDLKSQILSLDSEIRIMNAKLLDFEELQCNKQRLLTKKVGGTTLLKEERFRKQMQSKFLANLKQLVNLLRSWESKENARFDDSLLSDDVRELLKEDTDQMENWVDMRTKLMRLRTVKAPTLKNRSNEDSSSSRRQIKRHTSRHAFGLTPPRKRMPFSSATNKPSGRTDTNLINKKHVHDHKNSDLRVRSGNNNMGGRSPKRRKRKEDSVPLPFGSILAEPSGRTDTDSLNKNHAEDHKDSDLRVRSGNNNNGERSPKRRKRKEDSVPLPFGSILADSPMKRNDYI